MCSIYNYEFLQIYSDNVQLYTRSLWIAIYDRQNFNVNNFMLVAF